MTDQQPQPPQAPGWGSPQQPQPQPPGWGPPQQPPGWGPPQQPPKKRHTGRNVALAVLGVLVALVLLGALLGNDPTVPAPSGSGGGEQPADSDADKRPAVGQAGQKVTIRDSLGRAMGVVQVGKVKAAISDPSCGELCKPERGLFVAARVSITAQRDGLEVNPTYFAVVDGKGQRYEVSGQAFTGGFGPALDISTLAKGQSTSGAIVFDVERAARHGTVVLVDWLDQSKTIATWTY